MSFAFIPYYIQLLGIESYGLIAIYAVVSSWMTFLDIGLTPTLGREMAKFKGGTGDSLTLKDLLRSIEIIATIISIGIIIVIVSMSHWIATSWVKADSLSIVEVKRAIMIMGFLASLRFAEALYRSSLSGLQEQVYLNVIVSIAATLKGIGTIGVLLWISTSIEAFFLWQAILTLLTVIVLRVGLYSNLPRHTRPPRFSFQSLTNVRGFAGGMFVISVGSFTAAHLDKLLLSKWLDLSTFGYYSMAALVAGTLVYFANPVLTAYYPRLCELTANRNDLNLRTTYHRSVQIITVIAGSVAALMICNSTVVLDMWTRDPVITSNISTYFQILLVASLFNCVYIIPHHMQLAAGWTRLSVILNFSLTIAIVPAYYYATRAFGAVGAAWVNLLLFTAIFFVGSISMHSRLLKGAFTRLIFKDILTPLGVGFIMALVVKWVYPPQTAFIYNMIYLAISGSLILLASGLASVYVRMFMSKIARSIIPVV